MSDLNSKIEDQNKDSKSITGEQEELTEKQKRRRRRMKVVSKDILSPREIAVRDNERRKMEDEKAQKELEAQELKAQEERAQEERRAQERKAQEQKAQEERKAQMEKEEALKRQAGKANIFSDAYERGIFTPEEFSGYREQLPAEELEETIKAIKSSMEIKEKKIRELEANIEGLGKTVQKENGGEALAGNNLTDKKIKIYKEDLEALKKDIAGWKNAINGEGNKEEIGITELEKENKKDSSSISESISRFPQQGDLDNNPKVKQ